MITTCRCWHNGMRLAQTTEPKGRYAIGITRIGTVTDVASLVAFITSVRGRWLHGATIDLDGGEVRAL